MKPALTLFLLVVATAIVRAQECTSLVTFTGDSIPTEFHFIKPIRVNSENVSMFLNSVTFHKAIGIVFLPEEKKFCAEKGDTILLTVADGTTLTTRNNFDTNCDGKFATFCGEQFGNGGVLMRLLSQNLIAIAIRKKGLEIKQTVSTEAAEAFRSSLKCIYSCLTNEAAVQELITHHNQLVFMVVEQMAEFPGGPPELAKFIRTNLKNRSGAQGNVFVSFIVEKDGSVTDIQIVKGLNEKANAAAIAVVSSLPKWKPGRQNNKIVRSRFVIPVQFK